MPRETLSTRTLDSYTLGPLLYRSPLGWEYEWDGPVSGDTSSARGTSWSTTTTPSPTSNSHFIASSPAFSLPLKVFVPRTHNPRRRVFSGVVNGGWVGRSDFLPHLDWALLWKFMAKFFLPVSVVD